LSSGQFSLFRFLWAMLHIYTLLCYPPSYLNSYPLVKYVPTMVIFLFILIALGIRVKEIASILSVLFALQAYLFFPLMNMNAYLSFLIALLFACSYGHPHLSWDNRNNLDPKGTWKLRPFENYFYLILSSLPLLFPFLSFLPQNYFVFLKAPLFFQDAPYHMIAFSLLSFYLLIMHFISKRPLFSFYLPSAWLILFFIGVDRHIGYYSSLIPFFLFYLSYFPENRMKSKPLSLFYDGNCGLCHNAVRFILAETPIGSVFFYPQQGKTFEKLKALSQNSLPDSLVLQASDKKNLLFKSQALLILSKNMGGLWQFIAFFISFLPLVFLDLTYDFIAKIRKKIFVQPENACPLIPSKYKVLFDPKN
jgi:predicted DCC family thiol-disulfide oxidoreductase YuxK